MPIFEMPCLGRAHTPMQQDHFYPFDELLTCPINLLQEAAQRNLDFILGIYADPIFLGDYPASVRSRITDLPEFTPEQRASLKGSADYFALNHYTSRYISHDEEAVPTGLSAHTERNGKVRL